MDRSCRLQGLSLVGTPVGAAPMEVSLTAAAGRKGSSARPLAERLPTGKCSRTPRKGGDGGSGVEGARGVRAFLLRKELFYPSKFKKFRGLSS
ncbi:hypothetical protein GW17_00061903 [Ensete ventricosum]|nr:hypothetical protein GW17_00061903 [Ensete ventricosum]